MEIIGIGVDIIEVERISRLIKEYPDRFLKRIFTEFEITDCQARPSPSIHFSGRWAAKEAVIKTLDSVLDNIFWHDLEIRNKVSGQPYVIIGTSLLKNNPALQALSFKLSISHTPNIATAYSICYRSKP